jgi:hypothetical protein
MKTHSFTSPARTYTARIHQSPTGRWHISDDALPHLDETGASYPTYRAACAAVKTQGWDYRLTTGGHKVRVNKQVEDNRDYDTQGAQACLDSEGV